MTLSEFKAWFDGFTEDMDGAPTEKQWERIKGRVGEITGQSVTYPVFVDRYIRSYPYPWYNGVLPQTAAAQGLVAQAYNGMAVARGVDQAYGAAPQFDSHAAMTALGKADAESLAS